MDKTINIEYESGEDETTRLEDIADILSEGVYNYLKTEGLLANDEDQAGRIEDLLGKVKKICARTEGDGYFENDEKTLDY